MTKAVTRAEAAVMRAIVDREHHRAVAERHDAIAAFKAANRPSRSTTGWSTKPPPCRAPSDAELAIDARVSNGRRDWAERHPAAAAAEHDLRGYRTQALERWAHKANGTAETHEQHARIRQGAIARLWQEQAIDDEQLNSAVEIASVAERIGADVAVKTASLETRIDQSRCDQTGFFERLGQVRREIAYTRWRAEVRGPIAAVLDMIVGDTVGYTVVATRYRMHNRRAKKLLIDALDLWPRILGEVCKQVDHRDLDRAHARLE